MKKRKKSQIDFTIPSEGAKQKSTLSKKELEKLKKDYKEGNLKFDSTDVADAIISQYKTL